MFTVTIALGLAYGIVAYCYAWDWAARSGPAHRLTSLALGTALGYLVPAMISSHALYFRWIDALETAFGNCVLRAFEFILHLSTAVSS